MTRSFRVRPGPARDQSIILNVGHRDLCLDRSRQAGLSFGTASTGVTVGTSKEIAADEILISPKAIKALHLPAWPHFELSVKAGELALGPLVGILAATSGDSLRKRGLRAFNGYVQQYGRLHGAVVVFALDGVDRTRKTVRGHCYDPQEDAWKEGVFPYPLAIYRRLRLDPNWRGHLASVIGDSVFNSHFPDKWEVCRWLTAENGVGDLVPDTVLHRETGDVFSMLDKYGSVYVKPIRGFKGRGIFQVSLVGQPVVRFREAGQNKQESFATRGELGSFLGRRLAPGRYIIQQQVDLAIHQGRVVDFRVIVQKDESRDWKCYAIVARVAAQGSIVSNLSSGGSAVPGELLLTGGLGMSQEDAYVQLERIRMVAHRVGKVLDRFMNAGTAGLDLGLDTSGRLWLLEVNLRDPDPRVAQFSNDPLAYYAVESEIMFYAKALAGFGPEESCNVL